MYITGFSMASDLVFVHLLLPSKIKAIPAGISRLYPFYHMHLNLSRFFLKASDVRNPLWLSMIHEGKRFLLE
jgi:hypothetical protein